MSKMAYVVADPHSPTSLCCATGRGLSPIAGPIAFSLWAIECPRGLKALAN